MTHDGSDDDGRMIIGDGRWVVVRVMYDGRRGATLMIITTTMILMLTFLLLTVMIVITIMMMLMMVVLSASVKGE